METYIMLQNEDVISITGKGKIYLKKISDYNFVLLRSVLETLRNGPQTMLNLKTLCKAKMDSIIQNLLDKGYASCEQAVVPKTTTTDLVAELEMLPNHHRYSRIIKNAKAGNYHDIMSTYDNPKLSLDLHLQQFPELEPLRKRVLAGEFSESKR